MKIIRARAMGMCFGVKDALEAVDTLPNPDEVSIHGELVHNDVALQQIRARGVTMTGEEERSTLSDRPWLLISAHGISDPERERLLNAGKQLIDTTCPLVKKVHKAAIELHRDGYHVLVIGQPRHVEVRGITGSLPDNYTVVERVEDVTQYPYTRLGVICQSTTAPRKSEIMLAEIRRCNPDADIRHINTICRPTRLRQEAVDELLDQVEALVVVGGSNSNNTREQARLALARGIPAVHVQTADQLDPQWFRPFQVVGLSAGTSTLDSTIEEVYERMLAIADELVHA